MVMLILLTEQAPCQRGICIKHAQAEGRRCWNTNNFAMENLSDHVAESGQQKHDEKYHVEVKRENLHPQLCC